MAKSWTTVTRKGVVGDRSTRRGGGNTWEKAQSKEVAKAAMDAMRKAPSPQVAKAWGQNVLARGERRMSISASKDREDPMNAYKNAYKNGGPVKGKKK